MRKVISLLSIFFLLTMSIQTEKSFVKAKTYDNSYMIVVDASGSMSAENRMERTKYAIETFLKSVRGKNMEVGLIAFYGCGDIRVLHELTTDVDKLIQPLRGIQPTGTTPLAGAITFSGNYLKANGVGDHGKLMVYTDGQDTCNGDYKAAKDAIDGLEIEIWGIDIDDPIPGDDFPDPTPLPDPAIAEIITDGFPSELILGETAQFTMKEKWDNGKVFDATFQDATIVSSRQDRVTVGLNGMISTHALGTSTITIDYKGIKLSKVITVIPPATLSGITVEPTLPLSLKIGEVFAISNIKARWSDGTVTDIAVNDATYTSSRPDRLVASQEGLLEAKSSGVANINISHGGKSISSSITVEAAEKPSSIYFETPAPNRITLGDVYTLANLKAKWSDGSITDIALQDATITSSYIERLSVTGANLEAIGLGQSTISVAYSGISTSFTMTVDNGPVVSSLFFEDVVPSNLKLGEKFTLDKLKAKMSDGSIVDVEISDAEISSSRADRLSVNSNGDLQALAEGSSAITIKYGGKLLNHTITVEAGPKPSSIYFETPSPNRITLGDVYTLGNLKAKWSDGSITDIALQDATITSSRADRLSITGANLEALALGQSIISAIYNGVSTTFTMTVDNGPVVSSLFFGDVVPSKLKSGEKFTLNNLKANMSDGSVIDIAIVDAELSSSRADRVSINANGELQALLDGSSTITIKYGGKVLNHTITVEGGLKPSSIYFETPIPNRITIGDVYTLGNLKAKWPDGSITDINLQDTTITSSYTNRLSVAGANLEALALGASTITVKYSGVTIAFTMTVDNGPVVSSLYFGNIVPTTLKLGEKFTLNQLKASMTDGSVVDVAIVDAELSSSRTDRVSVSPNGELEGLATGTSSITVKYGGKSIVISVKVDPAPTVSSITLENPLPTTMRINDKVTVGNIVVKWSDGSTTIESISDATITSTRSDRVGVNGIVLEAKAVGITYVDVVYKGKSIRTTVQVSN